jgi:hypothetical protein
MVAAWIAPCSAKASERLRRPPQFDVAKRDIKFANSSVVSSNLHRNADHRPYPAQTLSFKVWTAT